MKILFDLYEIGLKHGKSIGIYNYAFALLKNLSKKDINIFVTCSGDEKKSLADLSNIEFIEVSEHYPNFIRRIKWRLLGAIKLAKKLNVDIYYSPKGFAPGLFKRNRKPFIALTIHDMIPFYYKENYPSYFGKKENIIITNYLTHSAKIANEIITISEFSKNMIQYYIGQEKKIHVIHNGVNIKKAVKKFSHPKYIFAITSNLPHKNKENVILGYIEYWKKCEDPIPITICGIEESQLKIPDKCKVFITYIPFADSESFADLFSNASLLLFLPKIEGFGFPPLEAMMYGVPSVVSNIPVFKEILADSVYYVNNESPDEIGKSIARMLTDHQLIAKLTSKFNLTLNKYSWTKNSDLIYSVFEGLIDLDKTMKRARNHKQ